MFKADNPLWHEDKVAIMRDILARKMAYPEIREKLRETIDAELIEENTWGDTFWGICAGRGENNLGKLWMSIRKDWYEKRGKDHGL